MPEYVRGALARLTEAGHVAYLVGGCVRDFWLGRPLKDHDIATSATPDQLERLFPRSIAVGKAFGVIKVPIAIEEGETRLLEIATFRRDGEYVDHRHPKRVEFADPLEDARRRDFTINGLFYDPKTTRILDFVGGVADLKSRTLRAIGRPEERFREDALRLLRAVRFAAVLGFEIDSATLQAIQARSRLIAKVSGERVRDELDSLLLSPQAPRGVQWLVRTGLLLHVLPEVDRLRGLIHPSPFHDDGDVYQQTLKVLAELARHSPTRSRALAWAGLLYAIGKPQAARASRSRSFHGFELAGAELALELCERLRWPRRDAERLAWLIRNQLKPRDVFEMRESTLVRLLDEDGMPELLALHHADATASDGNLAFYEFLHSRYLARRGEGASPGGRLISGEDLIQMGLTPGPRFAEILRTIEDLALEGRLKSKAQALELVLREFVR